MTTNNIFNIQINTQQLQYIQKAIKFATDKGLPIELDEMENDTGDFLVDMIDDTINEEYEKDTIHGFCI